jgi:hypothetical protein
VRSVNVDNSVEYVQSFVDGFGVQIPGQQGDNFVEETPGCRIDARKLLFVGEIEVVLNAVAES